MNQPPIDAVSPAHKAIAHRLNVIRVAVQELQVDAAAQLAGVPWDFTKLHDHLERLTDLLNQGLALKAFNEHLDFTVSSPAKLLVKMRGKTPEHLTRRRGYLGGKVTSEAKALATRLNLELARKLRWKVRVGAPVEARREISKLRRLLRRLRYRESCAVQARKAGTAKRAPRRDHGKRAKRIAMLRDQVTALEAKWPSLCPGCHRRTPRAAPTEDWLLPPVTPTPL